MNNSYVADIGPRPTQSPKAIPNHIASRGCIIRSVNWLGDAVMTVPAVYRIKKSLPQGAKLSIVCIKSLEQFWKSFPWIDEVHELMAAFNATQNLNQSMKGKP